MTYIHIKYKKYDSVYLIDSVLCLWFWQSEFFHYSSVHTIQTLGATSCLSGSKCGEFFISAAFKQQG